VTNIRVIAESTGHGRPGRLRVGHLALPAFVDPLELVPFRGEFVL
jgi:hypothetical protein